MFQLSADAGPDGSIHCLFHEEANEEPVLADPGCHGPTYGHVE